MFDLKKGTFGYRSRLKKSYLIILIVLIAAIAVELYARRYFNDKMQLVITIMTALTALPGALLISRLLTISKFKPLSAAMYQEYSAYEEKFPLLYDLLFSCTDRILPMDVIAVHPTGGIYAFCSNPKLRVQKTEDEINEILQAQNLNFILRISVDKKTFDKRMKSLKPSSDYEENPKMEEAISVLKAMAL